MDSIRKQILANRDAQLVALKAAGTIKAALQGTFEPDYAEKPVASVIPEMDEITHEPDDLHIRTLSYSVRGVVKDELEKPMDELEDLLAAIDRQMMADPSCGGLAFNTRHVRTHYLFRDEHYPMAGADMDYETTYETKDFDPALP